MERLNALTEWVSHTARVAEEILAEEGAVPDETMRRQLNEIVAMPDTWHRALAKIENDLGPEGLAALESDLTSNSHWIGNIKVLFNVARLAGVEVLLDDPTEGVRSGCDDPEWRALFARSFSSGFRGLIELMNHAVMLRTRLQERQHRSPDETPN